MRTIHLIFILIFLTLCSCETKTNQQFEKDIVGEWTFVKREDHRNSNIKLYKQPPTPFGNSVDGYIFFENNNCENKLGYYSFEGKKGEDRKTVYYGNKTKYKIENDSLKILDLVDNTLESQKIFSILSDTLTLQESDSVFSKYVKVNYKINPNENYDKIIVSTSACFGRCPVLDISIDNDGNIIYFGQFYNTQNGLFTSKITKEEYQNIEASFKKADIQNLKDNYEARRTDDATVTVTFIKNNKIVKTISDYGRQSPTELIWAYSSVIFLYQQIKLIPLKKDKSEIITNRMRFEKGNQICSLTDSESFYLITEIIKGKNVTLKFDDKYIIEIWNDKNSKEIIYTDGRYFKFKDETIDIGYNFLKENNFTKKFISKT